MATRKGKTSQQRRGKNKSKVTVNFSGVETRKTTPEGDYVVAVDSVEEREGDAGPYLAWTFKIDEGKYEGSNLWINTSLSDKSLWNLKALLEALGVDVPDDEADIDFEEMVGLKMCVTVEHETFQGKKQARVVDFWEADGKSKKGADEDDAPDFDEMDEDDLAKFIKKNKLDVDIDDLSVKKARKAVKEAFEEAGEGGEEEVDLDELDLKGLKKLIKSEGLDVDPDDYPTEKKLRKAIAEAVEGGGEDNNKKGGKKRGKKKESVTADEVKNMDEDELQEFIDEHDLDVKLSKHKTLRKMQAAVVEAGVEAEVVEGDDD